MLDTLYHLLNYTIAVCYFCIFMLIFVGLLRQKALGRNLLGSATSGIFLTCSMGHLIHAVSSHVWGNSWEAGAQVIVDGWTTLPAITYLILRRKYGLLISGPDMINEFRTQLAQQSAQLKVLHEFEQLKDDFIAMAGHELRTPLTVIKGYAQILSLRINEFTDKKTVIAVNTINQQVNRMSGLINMLLDVSRIQNHELDTNFIPIDFGAFLNDLIGRLQITSSQHTLNLQIVEAKPIWINADTDRLEQVVTNLVSNAIKYSASADRVDLIVRTQDTDVVLDITDYGIGIPSQELEKVFDRFYRSPEVKNSNREGLGLGLYICNQIVSVSGGKITVRSTPGNGSTFSVYLPRIASPSLEDLPVQVTDLPTPNLA